MHRSLGAFLGKPLRKRSCKNHVKIIFTDGNLQLTYSGLPPVEGCNKGSNSIVVFYFECGKHVGQPQFERYVVLVKRYYISLPQQGFH